MFPFLGPAFVASVAYVDPGNFATNVQAGSVYGYTLLWVVVASNVMAVLLQSLSATLGIATGQNLAEVCRARLPRPVTLGMWVGMELVAVATDLAEFLGAAVGFSLLFGFPLWVGGALTAVVTVGLLETQRRGHRPLEVVIVALLAVIAGCYLVEIVLAKPAWGALSEGAVVPRFGGRKGVVLAAGILGATVMPHALYLHSALTQARVPAATDAERRSVARFERLDVMVAMGLAGLVNAAILVTAAAAFHRDGVGEVATLETAYRTLEPVLGRLAEEAFALSLLVAGLSSSVVGTLAGQTIMTGFTGWDVPIGLRRAVTMAPSLVVIALGLDPTRVLVVSQVVLSVGLPLAVVPLVAFTARRDVMGPLVAGRATAGAAWVVTGLILALNGYLLSIVLGIAG